jgi:uncharacterized protein (TIGR01777 family)
MNILIAGSSGLVGSALMVYFASCGHRVYPLVRGRSDSLFTWNPLQGEISLDASIPIDVVINLCGESSKGRWTIGKKATILKSRVDSARLLSREISCLNHQPGLFISASAVGYYGNTQSSLVDESADGGDDFLAYVASEWENATLAASEAGIRTVNARMGMVLSKDGGALKEMLTPFKLGLGGAIGNGQQYWSWVEIDELVNMFQFIIDNHSIAGPVNLVSKSAVTNREFTKALGHALSRPTIFPMPSIVARMLFGEMADAMLLSSVRVAPAKLEQSGYTFLHQNLKEALNSALA